MRAALCEELGSASNLIIKEVPDPEVKPGHIVVDLHVASVNYPDSLMCEGRYQFKPPLPFSPGSEAAGTISSVGDGVTGFSLGDRVIVSAGHGCFAEKICVPMQAVSHLKGKMSFAEGASFTMIYGTSYYALKQRGNLKPGETLLVLGAAGGVGYAAVELGKAMGATVIAGASSDEKLMVAKQAGADHLVNYADGNFKEKVKALTGGKGADVIYDPVGGDDSFDQCMRCVNWNGRILVIGFVAGIPRVPTNLTLLKGSSIVGVFWGRHRMEEAEENAKNFEELFQMYDNGKIKPPVLKNYSLEQTAEAITFLADRKAKGKVVVNIR